MNELPKGWVSVLAEDICEKVQSGSTPRNSPFTETGDVPYLKVYNIVNQKIAFNYKKQFISNEIHEGKLSRSIVFPNDVLMNIVGPPLGKVAIVGNDFPEWNINQAITLFRPNKSFLLSRFLYYFLNEGSSVKAVHGDLKGSVGQVNISLSQCRNFDIPVPPISEQKRIVEKLDEVLAQVDTIKARLDGIPDLLKRFRQSVLASAVSGKLTEEWRGEADHQISLDELLFSHRKRWEKSKLDDFKAKDKLPKSDKWKEKYKLPESVVDESVWLTPSNWCWASIDTIAFVTKLAGFEFTKFVKYVDEGTVPVIKAENVGKDGFKKTNFSLVPKSIVEALPRSEIYGGELLVTFVGAGVGQVCRVPSDRKYFLGPNVALARVLDTNVDERYIEFLFKSNGGFKNLLSQSKGAAQPSLSMTQIRQTSVPIPPLGEQKEIVRLVDQYFAFADTIETQVKKAQARVDNLTQSILAKAFRGELVAQDPSDEPADKVLERFAEARADAEALTKAAKKAEAAKKRAAKKATENS